MNSAQWFNRGALLSVYGPVLLIILALLGIYQTFIRSEIFMINTPEKKHTVRINYLENQKTIVQLLDFLKSKQIEVKDKRGG